MRGGAERCRPSVFCGRPETKTGPHTRNFPPPATEPESFHPGVRRFQPPHTRNSPPPGAGDPPPESPAARATAFARRHSGGFGLRTPESPLLPEPENSRPKVPPPGPRLSPAATPAVSASAHPKFPSSRNRRTSTRKSRRSGHGFDPPPLRRFRPCPHESLPPPGAGEPPPKVPPPSGGY